jgi:formylglycine-generating enzyme required for sulfatase activity
VALSFVLLIACGVLGYLFLGDETSGTSTATFIPGEPWTVPTASIEMLWCEPGTFMMGSPENEKDRHDDETRHEVTLTKGFYLGKYEVTQAQWTEVMGRNPSWFKGDDLPVEQVSCVVVTEFCQKLTQLEKAAGRMPDGWKYTLPTEAQ